MKVIQKYVLTLNFVKDNTKHLEKRIDLQSEAIYVENKIQEKVA